MTSSRNTSSIRIAIPVTLVVAALLLCCCATFTHALGGGDWDSDADHYRTLGLRRGAHLGEVKRAYRRMSLIHHPDKARRGDVDAHKRFEQIVRAHDVLVDEKKAWTIPRGGGEGLRGGMRLCISRAVVVRSSYACRAFVVHLCTLCLRNLRQTCQARRMASADRFSPLVQIGESRRVRGGF